jgi:hypothetical protein
MAYMVKAQLRFAWDKWIAFADKNRNLFIEFETCDSEIATIIVEIKYRMTGRIDDLKEEAKQYYNATFIIASITRD